MVKGGYNVTRSFVQGGIADFTVFDEKEARLADFVIDAFPDAEDTFIGYMAADENDTFFEGKLKNVIEGGIVGSAAELLFKIIRFSRGTRKRLDQGDIDKAKDYAEKQAKDIEETQAKVEEEQLELFPDDPRIQRSVDEVAEEAKGTAGVGRVKEFTINKLKGTDYFKALSEDINYFAQQNEKAAEIFNKSNKTHADLQRYISDLAQLDFIEDIFQIRMTLTNNNIKEATKTGIVGTLELPE